VLRLLPAFCPGDEVCKSQLKLGTLDKTADVGTDGPLINCGDTLI
jgi:hypothetical protein